MGLSRDSRHKRRKTGGRRAIHQKKRKYEIARPSAMTKLVDKDEKVCVREVRVRGGNKKYRALRLNRGNMSWGSLGFTAQTKILDVVYNATNNELQRTKTLVKNCVVQVEGGEFRKAFETYYRVNLSEPLEKQMIKADDPALKKDKVLRKFFERQQSLGFKNADKHVLDQFKSNRVLACISSRPGQSGRCDGYILEGDELDFYRKKMKKK